MVPGFSADAADWCIPAIRHLVRQLARTDAVRVFAIRYPYRAGAYGIDGAAVHALGGAKRRGLATLGLWQHSLQLLHDEHRRRPFDVLHAFWATESGLLAAIAGRVLRVPVIVSLAGGELVGFPDIGYGDQLVPFERLKVRASLRLATVVTAGSHAYRLLAKRFRRIEYAPLGVDVDLFKPPNDQRPGGLIHVGSLTPVKDQATLIRAAAKLRDLDVIGDGPLRQRLEHISTGNVTFRGAIRHDELPAAYQAASVFVMSSRHEAQCMAALEAAACGLAIVGTRVGIIPELEPTASIAVNVGDAQRLASAVERVAQESGRGCAARELVCERYSLAGCAQRFRAIYARLSG